MYSIYVRLLNGKFALIEEPLDSPLPEDRLAFRADAIRWPESWQEKTLVTTSNR